MICPYCGTKNNKHANVCKKCGKSLNPISTMKKEYLNAYEHNNYEDDGLETQSDGKALIIICLSVIFCVAIILGSVFFISQDIHNKQSFNNNSNSSNLTDSINQDIPYTDDDAQNDSEDIFNSDETYDDNDDEDIKIINGSFNNGNRLPTKTLCTVNVGENHAGDTLKMQVVYSFDGDSLNDGQIIQKTVNNHGEISFKSSESFKNYPDFAIITIYDDEENILDTVEVSLSANKGIQTF